MREKSYHDMNEDAKNGIEKFCRLSSARMRELMTQYEKETGVPAGNIHKKEEFYTFVNNNICDCGRTLPCDYAAMDDTEHKNHKTGNDE
jgi:hypothetical protein